jgi:hypothetical protein
MGIQSLLAKKRLYISACCALRGQNYSLLIALSTCCYMQLKLWLETGHTALQLRYDELHRRYQPSIIRAERIRSRDDKRTSMHTGMNDHSLGENFLSRFTPDSWCLLNTNEVEGNAANNLRCLGCKAERRGNSEQTLITFDV